MNELKFAVFIDESGEAGIKKIRDGETPGASPYFVLGAVVCAEKDTARVRGLFSEVRSQIGKSWKHATELSHSDKVFLARKLGKFPIRYFAVISRKKTLKAYRSSIEHDPQKFYNKCVQYLLERICEYLIASGVEKGGIRVVFEGRNHDYGKMVNFLRKVKEKPIYPQSKVLYVLELDEITHQKKGNDSLLDIADFVSHAVYSCVNKTPKNYFIPEPRYFREIAARFAPTKDGSVLGAGLKCIHSIEELELDDEIQEVFKTIKGQLPERMK